VVLVGLPGAGKSAVGAELAAQWDVEFADSDALVVNATGRSVAAIFTDDGEAGFRRLEARAIADALADFDGVLALGGGAVTTESVRRQLVTGSTPVALLTAPLPELIGRMAGTDHRPLLAGAPAARLAELSEGRSPLYREVATLTIDTAGRSVAAVAIELRNQLTGDSS
jgi:shikimate kinase